MPVSVNKFYWNTALPIHLHTVYCCFCAMTAELNRYNREPTAQKANNFYYLALHQKVCQTLLPFMQSKVIVNSEEPMLDRFLQTSNKRFFEIGQ